MSDEYTLADTQFPPESIKSQVIGGILYVDGVKVQKWQLTDAELLQHFPEDFHRQYGHLSMDCPVDGCGHPFDGKQAIGKSGFPMHANAKHKEWFEKNRDWYKGFENVQAMFDAVKAGEDNR